MLLFNWPTSVICLISFPFQYISCYYSTATALSNATKIKFQYISCYYSTSLSMLWEIPTIVSIHLMLLFNHSKFNILTFYNTIKSFIFKLFFDFYQPLTSFHITTTKSLSNPCHYWLIAFFHSSSAGKIITHIIQPKGISTFFPLAPTNSHQTKYKYAISPLHIAQLSFHSSVQSDF